MANIVICSYLGKYKLSGPLMGVIKMIIMIFTKDYHLHHSVILIFGSDVFYFDSFCCIVNLLNSNRILPKFISKPISILYASR